MPARGMFRSVLFSFVMVGIFSPASALTQQELIAKLKSAGYSQIREVKSTAEPQRQGDEKRQGSLPCRRQ